ncbi:hypothetical protein LOK49_LG05G03485 [Camellia lanceoleosa]|uniref:Uncharacterized protein n=1 Tax=Camellia lanceoleosa TaxID=1840588 RepID=A0ACC0HTU9_9ERIC|nr:hypothetical protein LOK49_LG05G03485 [Camellia lanceoleosa]
MNSKKQSIPPEVGWFSKWNSSHGIKSANKNGNGFFDENEINNLADFEIKKVKCANCSMLKKVMFAFFFSVYVCVSMLSVVSMHGHARFFSFFFLFFFAIGRKGIMVRKAI